MLGLDTLGTLSLGEDGAEEQPPREGTVAAQMTGGYGSAIVGVVAIVGALAAGMEGAYASSITGGPVVSGSLAVQTVGTYEPSGAASVTVTGALTAQLTGEYAASGAAVVLVTGSVPAQMTGVYVSEISGVVDIAGDLAAQMTGEYASGLVGDVIVSGSLAVQAVGEYVADVQAVVPVSGALDAALVGDYTAAALAEVLVAGDLAAVITGEYAFGIEGAVTVEGAMSAQMVGAYAAQIIGDLENGFLAAQMTGTYTSAITGKVFVAGAFDADVTGEYTPSGSAAVAVDGLLAVQMAGTYAPDIDGTVTVNGDLAVTMAGEYVAAGTGESLAPEPRDPAAGFVYLVEIDAWNTSTDEVETFRFGSRPFTTRPVDSPPNAHYEDRLKLPGDYSRSLFSSGRTGGVADVGIGVIELVNADGGLDALESYAFDGRRLRIRSIERGEKVIARAVTVFDGTMEQVEFTWGKVSIRLRDRLAALDTPLQETLYTGTTTSGGLNEAEGGPDDLAGRPKPITYGAPLNVPAVESNSFEKIYDLGIDGLQSIAAVRDSGVPLTAGANYTTITALRSATVSSGTYATQLNAGRIRLGSIPAGQVTAYPVAGANAAARTAAQVARQMLIDMGMVENTDFLAADVSALDALNDAVVGYWTGTDGTTGLEAIGRVLNSIGASISPDRLGVFRMQRFAEPAGDPLLTIVADDIIEISGGVERLATGDQGRGVSVWRVNYRYAPNYTVMSAGELNNVLTSAAFRTFASLDWRTVVAEDASVKTAHLLSPEMTVESYLVDASAAQAEADRLLALHSVARSRFRVPVKSVLVEGVDLGDEVRLEFPRFGLASGKNFRVIGIDENFRTTTTTLDLWG